MCGRVWVYVEESSPDSCASTFPQVHPGCTCRCSTAYCDLAGITPHCTALAGLQHLLLHIRYYKLYFLGTVLGRVWRSQGPFWKRQLLRRLHQKTTVNNWQKQQLEFRFKRLRETVGLVAVPRICCSQRRPIFMITSNTFSTPS